METMRRVLDVVLCMLGCMRHIPVVVDDMFCVLVAKVVLHILKPLNGMREVLVVVEVMLCML